MATMLVTEKMPFVPAEQRERLKALWTGPPGNGESGTGNLEWAAS